MKANVLNDDAAIIMNRFLATTAVLRARHGHGAAGP